MMKKIIRLSAIIIAFSHYSFGQSYPTGQSEDSITVEGIFGVSQNKLTFYVYKPLSYDSLTSPLIIGLNGIGGDGTSTISHLMDIAERRHALIIGPNLGTSSGIREGEGVYVYVDTIEFCGILGPASVFFKKMYRQVLAKENRISIPSYLIGFSAGSQFVTRYMLIRQAYPDSIPIQMAVSSNAYFYTFPTDTFNTVAMPWLCGFIPVEHSLAAGYCPEIDSLYNFFCDEDVTQYYNENYGVLIGTADLQTFNDGPCGMIQGSNRYERAQTFYNFCDSNATNRGLTLQWQYAEVPGVGHDEYGMYNTKATPTDSSTIAETLLFDTPHHSVPNIAPVVGFYADTTVVNLNGTVHFYNTSYNTSTYIWDFGDSSTSTATNPNHQYTTPGNYTVQLNGYNSNGCNTWNEIRHYITVLSTVGINEISSRNKSFKIIPNPVTERASIVFDESIIPESATIISILDISGRIVFQTKQIIKNNRFDLDVLSLSQGTYSISIQTINKVYSGNVVIIR